MPKYFLIKRITAGLIDYTIWFGLFWSSLSLFGEKTVVRTYEFDYGWIFFIGLWIIVMIIPETLFQSTIGNLLLKLKVVNENGGKIKFSQSLLRHCADMIDMWPLGLVGILTIKYSKKHQRLGDMIGKTIVIERN
ncbi:RDD family protein [uncultured Aquimarina sp.]|uniref:RDD family protein n=1 Tax=uncultured Aquimarina sp. TaxID=575652 RepID=UPI002616941B|nr:RDD family protein [uncultured Aquimarina sp.]